MWHSPCVNINDGVSGYLLTWAYFPGFQTFVKVIAFSNRKIRRFVTLRFSSLTDITSWRISRPCPLTPFGVFLMALICNRSSPWRRKKVMITMTSYKVRSQSQFLPSSNDIRCRDHCNGNGNELQDFPPGSSYLEVVTGKLDIFANFFRSTSRIGGYSGTGTRKQLGNPWSRCIEDGESFKQGTPGSPNLYITSS